MVCALSKSTTKGLSISALASSSLALLLGILAVVSRKKGSHSPKALVVFLVIFYLVTVALILASGFAVYGRSVAKCEDKKKTGKPLLNQSKPPPDNEKFEDSKDYIIFLCVSLAIFIVLTVVVCIVSKSKEGCGILLAKIVSDLLRSL